MLNRLKPPKGAVKKPRRKGQGPGSGNGKTAGRGIKGQKSRSGGGVPPYFEGGQMPLHRRLPKKGFKNINRVEYQVVNVEQLNIFEKGTKIDKNLLLEKRIIRKKNMPVKLLGRGSLEKEALEIVVDKASNTAIEKVNSMGGKVEVK